MLLNLEYVFDPMTSKTEKWLYRYILLIDITISQVPNHLKCIQGLLQIYSVEVSTSKPMDPSFVTHKFIIKM